jgi:hypothetical protein
MFEAVDDFLVCSLPLAVAATDKLCNAVHRKVSEVESSTRLGFCCVLFVTLCKLSAEGLGGGDTTLMDMT